MLLGGSERRPDLDRADVVWASLLWLCLRGKRWLNLHGWDLHSGHLLPTKTPGAIVAEIRAKWEGDTGSRDHIPVLYPLLRVEIPEIKIESVRGFPPRLIRPMGVEPLDLEIDGDLSPLTAAKGDGLAKLAPQLPIGAL